FTNHLQKKHARNILFGAHTFWAAVNRLPLSSNAVLCWKFCHVFHKLLRDGHPNVTDLSDMSRMWGHLSEGYGKLCSVYLKLLITKMEFHVKVSDAPPPCDRHFTMFDYLECELNLFLGVFSSLDMSRSVSVTAAGQCRLAPLIQVILDSSHLYDYTVKLLFKLHSCLPADTLQGHRDRFQEQFKKLKSLFYRSSNLQYFKRLIQIPQLPENPPNFLRASALSEHISPVVVIPAESSSPETEHMVDMVTEDLVDTDVPNQPVTEHDWCQNKIPVNEALPVSSQNLFCLSTNRTVPLCLFPLDRCGGTQVRRPVWHVRLHGPLQLQQSERDVQGREVRRLHRTGKAVANEQRYTKLKEKYTELVQGHADLLRKVGPPRPRRYPNPSPTPRTQACRRPGSSEELGAQLSIMETEKAELVESLSKKEAELSGLGEELERIQSSLANERESGVKTAEALQNQLNQKESREQALESQLVAARWATLQGAVEEAERIVTESLALLDDPAHISCTSSADYLASRCQASLDCLDRLHSARNAYLSDNSELVRAVTQFAHLVGDTIVQGSATSHMVPVEQADALSDSVKACGGEALALLAQMKEQESLAAADSATLRAALDGKLRPRGLELQQGELGDLVEQEMAATSAAVESAATRIEGMLNKSRAVDTGVKMEVNERILASCTDLMQAIKELVLSSKDLQRDIVESGRGAASMKEFYAKNSRWTEGLISASKAVGWGATVLVDAADLVVQGKGKYEELMVCSHEIAASTAQLVAASKVKADKDNANLGRLKLASRGVTQATAGVVASTKSGKSQIEEKDTMDFSSMTLTQIKRQEMDSQVSVLELETKLQKERERLGETAVVHWAHTTPLCASLLK
uniref:I/LWEQ domain-containing protein n=1 Tax=Esox lucius TaxID=8010 RepID=A0A3P8YRC0_ESOLU